MSRALARFFGALALVVVVLALVSFGSWLWVKARAAQVSPEPPPAPLAILTAALPSGPDAALIQRGRYLAIAGDCASCHTRAGGPVFAGGLGLRTPLGVIYSANITPDRRTGIGAWSEADFRRAMSRGVAPGGRNLYPAFPYPHFTLVSAADDDAILAYLKSVPPVRYTPPGNLLPFPLNIRLGMVAWNALFLHPGAVRLEAGQPAAWSRGAELVSGLGHCGACHTPTNLAQAEEPDRALQGAELQNWVAPNLTGDARTGLGRWTLADLVEYLRTGRNVHSNAAGPMAEVVSYSTSLMSDADLQAIATYLKSLPAHAEPVGAAPDPSAMRRGAAVFSDACASCHLADGRGQPRFFPPLPGSAVAQQRNPDGLLHIILAGARTGPTLSRPSALTMPSFAWKLSDQEIADVATFVRDSWGNRASPVDARAAASLRGKLRLKPAIARD